MSSDARRAGALMALGDKAFKREAFAVARQRFEEALKLRRAGFGATHPRVADSLHKLADTLRELGDFPGARAAYEEALTILRGVYGEDHVASARSVNGLGMLALRQGDKTEARNYFERALAVRRTTPGVAHADVAVSLSALGLICGSLGNYADARDYFLQALAIRRQVFGENHPDVALSLNHLGIVFDGLQDYASARDYHLQALAVRRRTLGEVHPRTASSLHNLGEMYYMLDDYATARSYYEEALQIRRKALGGTHPDVAMTLDALGSLVGVSGDTNSALDYQSQALTIRRQVLSEEHPDLGNSYFYLGSTHHSLGNHTLAESHLKKALEIRKKVLSEAHPDVASCLSILSSIAHSVGDFVAAIDYAQKALSIWRQTRGETHTGVASGLMDLGNAFQGLNDHRAAYECFERAVAIRRAVLGDSSPEIARSLGSLGNAAFQLGQHADGARLHAEALAILRQTFGEKHYSVAVCLHNFGAASDEAGNLTDASRHLQEALAIKRHVEGDWYGGVCHTSWVLASVWIKQGLYGAVPELLDRALQIALLPDNEIHLCWVYWQLSALNAAQGSRDVAIFFGKQAVNAIQSRRSRLTTLASELQRSFMVNKQAIYRDLSNLLVDAGRLGEAQQVIAMLKEEELFDLLRRDAASDPRLTFAQLTSLEAQWRSHGDALGQDIVRLTGEVSALRKLAQRSAEEEARLRTARTELDAVGRAFRGWLDGLRGDLAASASRDAHSADINLDLLERLQGDLRTLGPDVALVSYIVGETKLSIILTTQSVQVSREADVSEKTINRLVHEFRLALDQKLEDATDLAKALWRHLIAPIAPLLGEIGVKVMMAAPYGSLRYLPLAALHDGERYLVERFAVSVLTLAAHASLRDRPQTDWRVAGFGVSREIPGYRRLLAVADELNGIVRTTGQHEGVYPGVIRLDESFTEDNFADALEGHQVVHVASHFVLNPARGLNSHLLMGDGATLSLERLRDTRFDFHEVELMTLSACETAMGGGKENGREFEGFAALVQQRGAKAVIASLWPVADESTAPLMTAFYRARRAGLSKAAALQSAQTGMLKGAHAHPYHWAPFILMGNWL